MTGKSVKDVDRYQAVLNSLLALEDNKFCADCESKGRCPSPRESTLRLVYYSCKNAALHSSSGDQLRGTMVQDAGATSLHAAGTMQ